MRNVDLYPTQPLVPQSLALGDDFFKGSGTDFGLRICACLCLGEEGYTNTNGQLSGAPRKREERPSLDCTRDETGLKVEARFPKTPCDEAVSSTNKMNRVQRA